jgi:hypothetical protein
MGRAPWQNSPGTSGGEDRGDGFLLSDRLSIHESMLLPDGTPLFPELPSDELYTLAGDIVDNGLKDKIVILEGAILDGWNRYRALVDILRWEPERVLAEATVEYTDTQSPFSYAVSKNAKRRHLTPGQRCLLADPAFPLYKAESKQGA